jgi:hypothetical protein
MILEKVYYSLLCSIVTLAPFIISSSILTRVFIRSKPYLECQKKSESKVQHYFQNLVFYLEAKHKKRPYEIS